MKQKKPIFNAVADTRVCECGRVVGIDETCRWCELKMARESDRLAYVARDQAQGAFPQPSGDEDV